MTAKARGLAFILRGPNLEAAAQEPCGIPLSIEVIPTCYWVRVVANSHPPSSPGDHSDQYTSEQRVLHLAAVGQDGVLMKSYTTPDRMNQVPQLIQWHIPHPCLDLALTDSSFLSYFNPFHNAKVQNPRRNSLCRHWMQALHHAHIEQQVPRTQCILRMRV